MPITKSAKKALRQTKRRTVRNVRRRESYKDTLKRARKLVAAKNLKEAEALIPMVYKALDKAAKNGVIKKNTAARKKSRLMRSLRKTHTPA